MTSVSATAASDSPFLYNQEGFIALMQKEYPTLTENAEPTHLLVDEADYTSLATNISEGSVRHRFFAIPSQEILEQKGAAVSKNRWGVGCGAFGALVMMSSVFVPCCTLKAWPLWTLMSSGGITVFSGTACAQSGKDMLQENDMLFSEEEYLPTKLHLLSNEDAGSSLQAITTIYEQIFGEAASLSTDSENNVANGLQKRLLVHISRIAFYNTWFGENISTKEISAEQFARCFIKLLAYGQYLAHMKRNAESTESYRSFVGRNIEQIKENIRGYLIDKYLFTQPQLNYVFNPQRLML